MLLPLLGICAVFGRFWGKAWEPVKGLLTDGCGCGDPRCCANLFVLCLFLLWQVRQSFRGFKNQATKKKGLEVSLLKWAAPPWHRLAIPVPSPGLSICPCTQKCLEIHVQKLAHRQKWGPPQKLRESWAQFLLSQLSGQISLQKSGEPGVCSPFFPSTCRCLEEYHRELQLLGGWKFAWRFCNIKAHLLCKVPVPHILEGLGLMEQAQEKTSAILPAPIPVLRGLLLPQSPVAPEKMPCYSLLSIEEPCLPGDQLVEVPEEQEPKREDQQLVRDEATQALGMEEGLVASIGVLEVGSQTNCSEWERHTYKDTSFPWGPALEDADSEASAQELATVEGSPDPTPLPQLLVQVWEESLQDIHEDFSGRGLRAKDGTGLMPGQPVQGTALELSPQDMPPPEWREESQSLKALPLFATPGAPTPVDTESKEEKSIHAVPPKRPALKKSSRLLLESIMRRKITHLKWGLPQRLQESEWLFPMTGPSSPNDGMQGSSPGGEQTRKEDSKNQPGEPNLREPASQSHCASQDQDLLKAASGAPDPVLQIQERLKCQELPMIPRKRKGKKGPGCAGLDAAWGAKQSPKLWGLQDLCDEALSRAMLPVITDCGQGGANKKPTGSSAKDSLPAMAWECKGGQEAEEEASPSELRPGPSNTAQNVLEKLGSPGPGDSMNIWPHDPCQKELNPKGLQDSQALPWATVCHWSMPTASRTQSTSDSGGDTPQSHSSEAHLLPAERRKRIFRSKGSRLSESGASPHSLGRAKGPFRTAAVRLGTALMNKMTWSLRQSSSTTSVSKHNECQEDPDILREAGSSGIPWAELPGRSWDREVIAGPDRRRLTRGSASPALERDCQHRDGSLCDGGMGESSAQAPQNEQEPMKSSWTKRLRGLLNRLSFNK